MTNLLFEIEIHNGDMVAECGSPSTSMVYYLISGEGGVEPLQVVGLDGVVGESGFGDVVDEVDEGDELEGDELNEGDEGDVFEGGNEDDNAVPGGAEGNEGNNSTHEVGGNEGNNASDAQPSMQPEPEVRNHVQPEVRNNAQPEVGNNAQPTMGIDSIRVRQYAPSTTRPNQPDVQAADWTELSIEDYEIHTSTNNRFRWLPLERQIWWTTISSHYIGHPEDLNLVFISDRQKRIGMEKCGGSVCPNVQDKLEKLKMESRSFFAMPSSRFQYEPVSVRDSIARGAGSGVGKGRGATSGVGSGASRGATSGASRGRGAGRGSNSGAGMSSTSG
uniref:Uncharacterized protein n=1 Tax=Fagus sylvatica TaxID=28930 RepID=A0A2N9F150_FAGSY